jgi:hypothetical protein
METSSWSPPFALGFELNPRCVHCLGSFSLWQKIDHSSDPAPSQVPMSAKVPLLAWLVGEYDRTIKDFFEQGLGWSRDVVRTSYSPLLVAPPYKPTASDACCATRLKQVVHWTTPRQDRLLHIKQSVMSCCLSFIAI